jgi:hypothetical protein
MPAVDVKRLASPRAIERAEAYLVHRPDVATAFAEAIAALGPAIDARQGKERRPFSKAILKLKKGTLLYPYTQSGY